MVLLENHCSRNGALAISIVTALAFLTPCHAQTTEEDEVLSPIVIDDRYADETDVVTDEQIDDLVLDEATGSYRLVEDDEGDDWVEPPTQAEQDTEELQRLFELYREALKNKDYLEADTLAKRVVELSIRINGLDSHDSAKAITNLGIAQHNNKDYEAALLNFSASIGIVERIDDRLSRALINPLQGLAATQAALGRPDMARKSYQRAVHVSHVNDGPHNADQVQTLESMAELYLSMGEFKDATGIQENIFAIQSRNVDPTSMDILPALHKRADWQHRLQRFQSERATWRQIINILEKHKGKESLELIAPLKNLGKSYLFVSPAEYDYQPEVSTVSGETHLRRANRIADANPDADWQIVEDTLLALGDYYILSGRPNRGARIYAEAWNLLSEGEQPERLGNRRDHLEAPVILQNVYPAKYLNSERNDEPKEAPPSFETGTISIGYTVLPNGRIANMRLVEAQPAEIGKFDETVARSLRRLIYRPRMQDGQLVATNNTIYTHEFFYRQSDLENQTPDADSTGKDSDETGEVAAETADES